MMVHAFLLVFVTGVIVGGFCIGPARGEDTLTSRVHSGAILGSMFLTVAFAAFLVYEVIKQ